MTTEMFLGEILQVSGGSGLYYGSAEAGRFCPGKSRYVLRMRKKTENLNEMFRGKLEFLQNNFYTYEDYALVGTKGYCYEGKDSYEHFLKIRERELGRLRCSLKPWQQDMKFIMFLCYPPTSIGEMESPFTLMAQEFGAEKVIYSHCHGEKRYDDSFKGYVDGIEYKLVSGDYLNFKPEPVLR